MLASVHRLDWLKTGCIDITENKPSCLHSIQALIFDNWLSEGKQVVYVSVLCLFLVVQCVTMVFPGHTSFLGKGNCIEYKDVLVLGSVYCSVSVYYILKIIYTIDPD